MSTLAGMPAVNSAALRSNAAWEHARLLGLVSPALLLVAVILLLPVGLAPQPGARDRGQARR